MSIHSAKVHKLATPSGSNIENTAQMKLLFNSAYATMKSNCREEITIKVVTSRAGLPVSSFYDHFSTIEEFKKEMNSHLLANYRECLAAIESFTDPASRLAAFFHYNLAFAKEYQEQCFVLFHGLWIGEIQEVCDYMKEVIGSIIEEGLTKGQFTVELSPAEVDTVLGALGLAVKRTFENDSLDSSYGRKITANILRSLGLVSLAAQERAQKGF